MKKLICTVLACIMLATTAFADTLTLTLDKAIETAKENNQQLSVNDYKKAAAEISLKSAYISRKDAKNAPVMFGDTATPLAKKGYYVTAAQTNIKLLDLEREKINNNISYDVKKNKKRIKKLHDRIGGIYENYKSYYDLNFGKHFCNNHICSRGAERIGTLQCHK